MPSKLLSAPGEKGTLRAAVGKERPSPALPAREPTQSLGRTDRGEGWAGGEVHRGGRDRPGGRVVPTATRVGLALPCPRGSPGWVTPWGCTARGCQGAQWDTHTAQPSVGSRTQPGLGELRGLQLLREAAATGSAHHIPPLARPTQSRPQTLCAAEPGPPPLRLLRPGSAAAARHSSRQLRTVPCWLGLRQSRAGCEHPAGFSKGKGPHTPPRNADVLQVCPTALALGLPGAALGSPPSGCQGTGALLTLSGGQG